jgi:hypothetical protein
VSAGCYPSQSASPPEKKQSTERPADEKGDSKLPSDTPNDKSQNATNEGLDIVMVVALGTENPSNRKDLEKNISTLMSSLSSELEKRAEKNARVGLIGSNTGTVSGIAVDTSAFEDAKIPAKQVNFEIAPGDVFVGSLVAGCDSSDSKMADPHKPGEITVCGKKTKIAAHSWTWANEDLFGRLTDFLRPGATRVYLIVASGDALHVEPDAFIATSSEQNKSKRPSVFAIVPESIAGMCNTKNKVATNIMQTVASTKGAKSQFCESDWSRAVDDIVGQIGNL